VDGPFFLSSHRSEHGDDPKQFLASPSSCHARARPLTYLASSPLNPPVAQLAHWGAVLSRIVPRQDRTVDQVRSLFCDRGCSQVRMISVGDLFCETLSFLIVPQTLIFFFQHSTVTPKGGGPIPTLSVDVRPKLVRLFRKPDCAAALPPVRPFSRNCCYPFPWHPLSSLFLRRTKVSMGGDPEPL